ncbi:cobalt-precorrin-6A reductase [Rhizobium sp. YIM 134829]|uniref:cobalt-precorrin-6A reductase n=1 Tax=Rhizobium sp. YIM 134829 TaxID=3390453 RepID=UPI003979E301
MGPHPVLILGGTTEAKAVAEALAARPDLAPLLSLAGRTLSPRPQPVPVRVGGFGGAEGLARFLKEGSFRLMVVATHPFAARISAHAARAAAETGVPAIQLTRPAWQKQLGDRWQEVETVTEAVSALGDAPKRVFLAIGRQEAAAFEAAPQHAYLIRSVDPVDPPLTLPRMESLLATGPFDEAAEEALLRARGIEVVVAKNSGGAATYGKIAAARRIGLPVILVARPPLPDLRQASRIDEVLAFADHVLAPAKKRGV